MPWCEKWNLLVMKVFAFLLVWLDTIRNSHVDPKAKLPAGHLNKCRPPGPHAQLYLAPLGAHVACHVWEAEERRQVITRV